MKRIFFVILLCFCMVGTLLAQKKSYRITFKWYQGNASCEGEMAYLTGFFGDERQVYDSAVVRKGISVFKGRNLPDGLYEVSVAGMEPHSLVISESRQFTYWTDGVSHIEGSAENLAYQLAYFSINTTDGYIPEPVDLEASSQGHDLVYKYLLLEYLGWEQCPYPDARLLRHPLFNQLISNKLQSEKINVIDSVFDRYGMDTEIGQYYMARVLKYYNMDNQPLYDEILVHLYDKYYVPSGLQLLSDTYERVLKRSIERKRRVLPGVVVPPLEALNTDGKKESTEDISHAYTVLWFWDPDCEDCQVETPALYEYYQEKADVYDFEVFAFSITQDVNRWKQMVAEWGLSWINTCDGLGGVNMDIVDYFSLVTTPASLLLDSENKIILRNFTLEELDEFLRKHYLE